MSYGWRRESGQVAEICDECGFDSRLVVDLERDLHSVLNTLHASLADPAAPERPAAEVWSAAEYVEHCVEITVWWAQEISTVAGLSAPRPATTCLGAQEILESLIRDLSVPGWDNVMVEGPFTVSARGALLHVLHDLEHHVLDVRRGYARMALTRGEDVRTNVR